MAHQEGLDLGNVLQQVETIRGQRAGTALQQQTLQSNVLAQQGSNQFNALLQQHLANPTPQTLNAIAAVDPQVAGQLQDVQTGQQEQEQRNAKIAVAGATNLINSADPKRFLDIALPELKEQLLQNGVDVDNLTNEEVVTIGNEIIARQTPIATFDVTPTAPKAASFKTFRNTETDETITVDVNNPQDAAIIRAKPGQFVPIETKVITGTPKDFAPLGKKAIGSVQEDIIALEDSSARVLEIGSEFQREFLTFQGRIRSSVSSLLDKADVDISSEEKAFIKSRKKFVTKVNREFNLYRKLITGAAAAEKELADLKKATINEDLGPIEFEAALEVYQEELQRGLRLKRALLRNGIQVGTDEFSTSFDNAFISGADDDSDLRLQELQEEGFDIEQSVDILIQEGYQ